MLTASVSHCEPGFSEGLLYLTPILIVLQFPLDGYKHHKIPQTTHNLLHTSLSNFLSPCLEKEFSTDTITNIIRCKLKCTVTLINTINLRITMFLVQPFLLLVDLHTIIYTLVSFMLQPCIASRYFSIIDVSLKQTF